MLIMLTKKLFCPPFPWIYVAYVYSYEAMLDVTQEISTTIPCSTYLTVAVAIKNVQYVDSNSSKKLYSRLN